MPKSLCFSYNDFILRPGGRLQAEESRYNTVREEIDNRSSK